MKSIRFPKRDGTTSSEIIQTAGNIVIVGANGAGKSRLGSWIEEKNNTQRISAQRALSIPQDIPLRSLEHAERAFSIGRDHTSSLPNNYHNRKLYKYGQDPHNSVVSDYELLLSMLFAHSSERNKIYTETAKRTGTFSPVSPAPLDKVFEIWNDLLPHRRIKEERGSITISTETSSYHGKGMSDGEKAMIYLIGQVLCSPDDAIIVIDEPETHIHKSLVGKLWDKIEAHSPSKTLIYITHDLDFACSRTEATKIWAKKYSETNRWIWTEVPQSEDFPEDLLLEILGSRRKIMFCEGQSTSTDWQLYQLIYPEYHVIPREGCDQVINATKALRANPTLHQLEAVGIIDTDYRSTEEIQALATHGIKSISVAEVENLFCSETVVRSVATSQGLNPDTLVEQVKEIVKSGLIQEIELQVASMSERRIRYLISRYTRKSNNLDGLQEGMEVLLSTINISDIHSECTTIFNRAIESDQLSEMLRVYNRKDLVNRLSTPFGLAPGKFKDLVLRLLKGERRDDLITAFRAILPTFTQT